MNRIFNEENIYKVSVIGTLSIILLLTISVGVTQYMNYKKSSTDQQELLRSKYLHLRKEILKEEIDNELKKIENSRRYAEKEELDKMRETVSEANNIISTIYRPYGYVRRNEIKDELDAKLELELDQYTDFYIIGENNLGIYLPKLRSMEGRNFSNQYADHKKYTDFKKIIGLKVEHSETLTDTIIDEDGYQRIEKRYIHIQKVSNTSWYIVYEKYLQDVNNYIQEYVVSSLQKSQSDTIHVNGDYIFVHRVINFESKDFMLEQLVNPNRPERVGKTIDPETIRDDNNFKYLIAMKDSVLVSENNDAFITYKYLNPETETDEEKLSYWKYLPDYQLLIGKGIYLSKINADLNDFTSSQKEKLKSDLIMLSALLLIFGAIAFVIAIYFARAISNIFKNYKSQVDEKQEQLEEQLTFQERLTNSLPNPIFFKNLKGEYFNINDAFCDSSGLTREEIIGKTDIHLFNEFRANIMTNKDKELLSQGSEAFQKYESNLIFRTGKDYDVIFYKVPFVNKHGDIEGIIGSYIDITERKRMENELALHRNNLEKMVEERTRELEETQDQLIESEKMAALGQIIAGVSHEINTPLGAIRSSVENIAKNLDTTLNKFPELFATFGSEQKSSFIKILESSLQSDSNISSKEKRKIKRKLINYLEEHFSLEDEESVADLLVDMGIYSNISDFDSLLKDKDGPEIIEMVYKLSGLKRSTKNINLATDRASKVVFALKNFSRMDQTGILVSADVTEGIETVLTLYYNQIKKGVELIKKYKKGQKILCYPDQLNQVWTNLLHNSIQAMEYSETKQIIIDINQKDDFLVVTFSDTGSGIPEDIRQKIFKPFFTTKPAGEGTGLGLDIVKKIIDKHNGKIEVESKPGDTRFYIYLPIKQPNMN
jgi:PAS domain S-box-containing protein